MGGLRRVDKACKKCGAMMYQVPSKRLYCDKCRDTVPRNMSKTEEKPKSSHCQKSCAKQTRRACNMRPTAKSTDFTKKKELWKVFRKHRKELFAYTVRGEGKDEEEATISLLAYENHCKKSAIYVTLEMR